MAPSIAQLGSHPLLSICIPAYNGGATLLGLIDRLLESASHEFEIVVSDDCSSDGTLDDLQRRMGADPRLRCQRNPANLGMDRNFAHSASLAHGRYIWFSGQDDLIDPAGVERVIDYLHRHPETDFILMNHAKRVVGPHGEHLVAPATQAGHVTGTGLAPYVAHTHHALPTFLPTYLIRAERWRAVDVDRYYGTCYCQVGVFLEAVRDMRWCHFAGNHVEGLEPANGWQTNPLAYVRITLGYMAMLSRARERADWVTDDMLRAFSLRHRRQLIYSFLLEKSHRLSIDPSLKEESLRAIAPFVEVRRLVQLTRSLPAWACSSLLCLIEIRRKLRARIAGGWPHERR
ncbi:MAG: glycosyltransferase [Hydrogenophaga sp.]|uniref:glycosyltransferase family 2 protein n=1 Tax=Hydrogenophaga sp. TaxID=1904254 RepID=UPI00262D15C5|nr:glycosyltransferase family 2 protein [Hydrogenophaga sp.]MCV0437836.1 glycosyltransferase [Hydrogenophaga sp.]